MPDQREIFVCEVGLFVCQLASQAISLPMFENTHSFFFAHSTEGTCGCLAPTFGWKIGTYGFVYQTNPFLLYLLMSVTKQ